MLFVLAILQNAQKNLQQCFFLIFSTLETTQQTHKNSICNVYTKTHKMSFFKVPVRFVKFPNQKTFPTSSDIFCQQLDSESCETILACVPTL